MPEKRFFLSTELQPHSQLSLIDEELQHLKVMRCHEGDSIEVMNGKGVLAQAKIIALDKRKADLEIQSIEIENKPSYEVILAQALPRLNRLDTILEKTTELGVTKILLFPGVHSEKVTISPNQLKRIEHILIASSKQCGRLYLPEVELKPPLAKWDKPEGAIYYGDVSPSAPLFRKMFKPTPTIIFFVGPETGLDDSEERILQKWNANGVKLHHNILRTDTAPIAALTLISHYLQPS